jgi:hypothetical protein
VQVLSPAGVFLAVIIITYYCSNNEPIVAVIIDSFNFIITHYY